MTRERLCEQCQRPFSYEIKTGSDRRLCSDACRTKRRHANAKAKPLCVVEGCSNRRGYASGICNACYTRLRRTGTLNRREYNYRSISSHGYVWVGGRKEHPLANVRGMLYEHRKVLYDAIGVGPHPCHWCGVEVNWRKSVGARLTMRGALLPDHLDGDKSNNAIVNLVPACVRCNGMRGLFMAWIREHKDDPWLWKMFSESKDRLIA